MDEPLFRIASIQSGVVLRAQLLAAGMSPSAIGRRVDAGWLRPVFPGAYCVTSTSIDRRQRVIAAVLLNPGSAADGSDAALLLGLESPGTSRNALLRDLHEPVHIVTTHDRRDLTADVDVRRQLHRDSTDVVRRFGVDVLSPARLVLDMAGRWPQPRVERILDRALADNALKIEELIRRHMQLQRRGRRGVAVLDALIDLRVDGQHRSANKLEAAIRKLLVDAGFPEPIRQHKVVLPDGSERFIDLAYPEIWFGTEVDGYRWHSARTDWAADQLRSNELVALGWRLFRATDEVLACPATFLQQVAALHRLAA